MNNLLSVAIGVMSIAVTNYADAGGNSELENFKADIRARYDMKENAIAAGDTDSVVDGFYSEDVISVDSNGGVLLGREAIRPAIQAVAGGQVKVESFRTHVEGNSGWDWTNYYIMQKDPEAAPFSLIIVFLWEKRDGQWWCVGDMVVPGKFDLPKP